MSADKSILPTSAQLAALPAEVITLAQPPPTLGHDVLPGGAQHCGGDLGFPNMTTAAPCYGYKVPVLPMVPGAVAIFPGADVCHFTTQHSPESQRQPGCSAHLSFAVQTPRVLFHDPAVGQPTASLHSDILALGAGDASSAYWADAVRIPVWHYSSAFSPTVRQSWSERWMMALPWQRVILYDVASPEQTPLVFFAHDGGLPQQVSRICRRHFNFLHDHWRFSLSRHSKASNSNGCLHEDCRGAQRMEMLGIHSRRRNIRKPPTRTRPGVRVSNRLGDLDAYVVHFDHPDLFDHGVLRNIFNAMSARMWELMPGSCALVAKELQQARTRERIFSCTGHAVVSDDSIVSNVGISAAYQSPPHFDRTDMGWTYAFACKCGPC